MRQDKLLFFSVLDLIHPWFSKLATNGLYFLAENPAAPSAGMNASPEQSQVQYYVWRSGGKYINPQFYEACAEHRYYLRKIAGSSSRKNPDALSSGISISFLIIYKFLKFL